MDPLAAVWRAAVAGISAPRRVADTGMLMAVLRPARSRLSYSCTEILVLFTSRRFTDIRDMNSLHGEKRFGTSGSTWSPSMVTESGTSEAGERSVVVPTLIASPSMLTTS